MLNMIGIKARVVERQTHLSPGYGDFAEGCGEKGGGTCV